MAKLCRDVCALTRMLIPVWRNVTKPRVYMFEGRKYLIVRSLYQDVPVEFGDLVHQAGLGQPQENMHGILLKRPTFPHLHVAEIERAELEIFKKIETFGGIRTENYSSIGAHQNSFAILAHFNGID